MKLKTSLQISAGLAIVLAILVGLGLFIRSRPFSPAPAEIGNVPQAGDAKASSLEPMVDKFFVVLVGIAALVVAGLTISASRKIGHLLGSLNQTFGRVGAGDLNLRLEPATHDELAETSQAFNGMIVRVRQTMDGLRSDREKWKSECEEGRNAAIRARQANMSLADALTKLKRAQQQIVNNERLRTLEQVAKGMARDFNATLTPIMSMTDFLLAYPEHLRDSKEVEESLKKINAAVRHGDKQMRLFREVFLTSEKTGGQAVDINKAIDEAIEVAKIELQSSPELGRELICEFRRGVVPRVESNEGELIEALAQVLVNAAESMPAGGKVSILSRIEASGVIVEVADVGEGMTEEVRRRCLEAFFSTRGESHSGMGLTQVVAVLGRYGGAVDVNSSLGKGTTVVLSFVASPEVKRKEVREPRTATINQPLRILVVDDEEYVRKILSKALTLENHKVETADSGQEGLKKATEQTFDVVILDYAMPDMMGDEVAAGIRRLKPDTVIILLTGLADVVSREGERFKCISTVLSKPATISDLRKAVAEAWHTRSQTTKM